ncbi:uncharacterized protein LOC119735189 [Patiria miniata]|uniref:Uncharacterized protein n=1 Tax=Patiria miniata TaxID=46514 RepID=A0A914AM61_PATMI|nr:uncharacterized protein LOC119735189 [Patiria miniata]
MFKINFAVMKLMVVMMIIIERASAAKLGSYGADPSKVSVSGVSSGANMAVQLHVGFSSTFMGVGAVAGAPYYCAQGSLLRATTFECSTIGNPANVDIPFLKATTEYFASVGKVDATSNMMSDRAYIFSGTQDIIVQSGLVQKLEDYYKEFVPAANIKTVYSVPAGHALITDDYGSSCGSNSSPYINDCDYNQAFEILDHTYGNLKAPTSSTAAKGQLLSFEQTEFFPVTCQPILPMGPTGYVYIPTGCVSTKSEKDKRYINEHLLIVFLDQLFRYCKLHVALHGCLQTTASICNDFFTKTGYNEVGELNDIIILYPQALINPLLGNPLGCWDWWGYTNSAYAVKTGWEMQAIKGMIDRILL